ncbi:ABC transporter permease [Chryseolinea lacunae]|uniref:ABC transporter permease n=1 Tax=Chryseolinea lacunae TaxID=2801331 RepID=A0ABS1KP04_9BACT|nr:ABC transporter permease [Chryseolinea lacunae]MBL0741065.1 ABC transporter permease [Chryseolinea lacunae]
MVTLRGLRKSGIYPFINIIGLAIGILCFLLISLWVLDELSYDRSHAKRNELYKIMANVPYDGKINTWGAAPPAAYTRMKAFDSRIVNCAITDYGGEHVLNKGNEPITKIGYYASPEFLQMFNFPLESGSIDNVLREPTSIVISSATAKALFGSEDPINKVIRVDNVFDQKVTGVLQDVPANSSLQFDFLLPWSLSLEHVKNSASDWSNYSYNVYVELTKGATEHEVENRIRELPSQNDLTAEKKTFILYPLSKWHLYSNFENGRIVGGLIEYVRLFSIIAIFILIMACINFMNLATARSERRALEVGIRKALGSGKRDLVIQFIGEAVLIATIAFGVAVLLAELILPYYNGLVSKHLSIDYAEKGIWLLALGTILFTGIVSGSYPAFYLSTFRPVQVLKGKVQIGAGATFLRRTLVTIQTGFSIILIIGTIVVNQQVQYVKNRDLGFEKANLLTIKSNPEIDKNYSSIKNELLQLRLAQGVTRSSSPITNIIGYNWLKWPGISEEEKVLALEISTEFDFLKTTGMKLIAGRDFSERFGQNAQEIIVNKAALDLMGLKDPIGAQLELNQGVRKTIVGISENAVTDSPYQRVQPLLITFEKDWSTAVTVRLNQSNDLKGAVSQIVSIFKKYAVAHPVEYSFVDVEFQKKFTEINLIDTLSLLFAGLGIIITGLGLFGLSSFTAEQRTKEIGIRRVMGASTSNVVGLIALDFAKLLGVAFLVSIPFAWWTLQDFLTRYTYRIPIPWWAFPIAGAVCAVFALTIVGMQVFRAARANPVKSLRSE